MPEASLKNHVIIIVNRCGLPGAGLPLPALPQPLPDAETNQVKNPSGADIQEFEAGYGMVATAPRLAGCTGDCGSGCDCRLAAPRPAHPSGRRDRESRYPPRSSPPRSFCRNRTLVDEAIDICERGEIRRHVAGSRRPASTTSSGPRSRVASRPTPRYG